MKPNKLCDFVWMKQKKKQTNKMHIKIDLEKRTKITQIAKK